MSVGTLFRGRNGDDRNTVCQLGPNHVWGYSGAGTANFCAELLSIKMTWIFLRH